MALHQITRIRGRNDSAPVHNSLLAEGYCLPLKAAYGDATGPPTLREVLPTVLGEGEPSGELPGDSEPPVDPLGLLPWP